MTAPSYVSDTVPDIRNKTDDITTDTFYEKAAKTRWGRYLSTAEEAALTAAASGAPPGIALEIGCDGGRWSQHLTALGWSTICVDIRPEAVELCRARLPNARCLLVDPNDKSFPVEANAVQLILIYEVPPVTQAQWFVSEATRVLSNEGLLVCTIYNPASLRATLYRVLMQVDPRRRRHNPYGGPSFSRMRRELEAHGFDLLCTEGLGWAPFTRNSDSRLIPYLTWFERLAGLRRLVRLSPLIIVVARRVVHEK